MVMYTFGKGMATSHCGCCNVERIITLTEYNDDHTGFLFSPDHEPAHRQYQIQFECGHTVAYDTRNYTVTERIAPDPDTDHISPVGSCNPPAPNIYTITFEKKPS